MLHPLNREYMLMRHIVRTSHETVNKSNAMQQYFTQPTSTAVSNNAARQQRKA